jgi:hypothetical protein
LPTFIRGRQDYRELILTTRLVPHVVVRGQISPRDDAVELVEIALDLIGLPGPTSTTRTTTPTSSSSRSPTAAAAAADREQARTRILAALPNARSRSGAWWR